MAELYPVGEYVAEELESRGWTTSHAATLLDGDTDVNMLWLDLLCCREIWEKHDIAFPEAEAEKLAELFGTSSQLWMNLHASYLRAKRENVGNETEF